MEWVRRARGRAKDPDVLGTRILSIVVHPDLVRVARVRAVIAFLTEAVLRDHLAGVFG